MSSEEERLNALINEILGKDAVTPGRFLRQEEALRPDVRAEVLKRLNLAQPKNDGPLFGPGMLRSK